MNFKRLSPFLSFIGLFFHSIGYALDQVTDHTIDRTKEVIHVGFEHIENNKNITQLNPQGIQFIHDGETAYEGEHFAAITLKGTADFLWNGNPALNRSELQFKPTIKEGSVTKASFHFMLPSLFSNTPHEFGYWESNASYRQIMRFTIQGNSILFGPSGQASIWQAEVLQAKTWYRIDMDIVWSSDPQRGQVSVKFNENTVVESHTMATLFPNEGAFIQLGILRHQTDNIETILLDDIHFSTIGRSSTN